MQPGLSYGHLRGTLALLWSWPDCDYVKASAVRISAHLGILVSLLLYQHDMPATGSEAQARTTAHLKWPTVAMNRDAVRGCKCSKR
jgi:hypothetical protein